MAIGPVQLLVLGFRRPDFQGEVVAELKRLSDTDTIRVIDALAVGKDPQGTVTVGRLSTLSPDEAIEFGSKVGALVGLGVDGEQGLEVGAMAGAQAAAEGVRAFTDTDAQDVVRELPNDSAAALILLEHRWAVPLRDAIARANGWRAGDAMVGPLDLVRIGMATAMEAEQLAALEHAPASIG